MKKTILMLTALVFALSLSAQDAPAVKPVQHLRSPAKMLDVKRKMIQDSLNLTAEEAAKFWTVYDKNEEARAAIRLKYRNNGSDKSVKPNIENMSDDAIYKMIESKLDRKLEMDVLNKKYYQELKAILPAKKIQKLFQLEMTFKKQAINRMNPEKRVDAQKPYPKGGQK